MERQKVMVESKRQYPLKPSEKPAGKLPDKMGTSIVDPAKYPSAQECVTTRYLWIRGVGEIPKSEGKIR